MIQKLTWLFLVLLGIVWACSSDDEDSGNDSFNRSVMLVNWADNLIIPAYQSFSDQLDDLDSAFDAFSSDKSEANLQTLRNTWLEAYKGWQKVALYEIGPAEDVGYLMKMNTYPANTSQIDQFRATGTLPSNATDDTRGFPALDYLFNGLADTDASIVTAFDANTTLFAKAVIDNMVSLTNTVLNNWTTGYRDAFVANSGSSANASVDRYVNAYISYYEMFVRNGKIGIPAGFSTGTPRPEDLEAFYSPENSKVLFLESVEAMQDFFNGKHFTTETTGASLASYLQELNVIKDAKSLDEIINDEFDEAKNAVSNLGTFKAEIENNSPPTALLLAYDEIQDLVSLLKSDMASHMNIALDADSDGD